MSTNQETKQSGAVRISSIYILEKAKFYFKKGTKKPKTNQKFFEFLPIIQKISVVETGVDNGNFQLFTLNTIFMIIFFF